MTLSYEEMLGWSVPPSAPATPVVPDPKQTDAVISSYAQPLQVSTAVVRQPPSNAVLWFVIGALFGFILCAVLEREGFDSSRDEQGQVEPEDKKIVPDDKKQVSDGRDMIFVTEIADNNSDTYEMDRLWDRIREFAATKKVQARRYDKEQGSAQRYIEFGASKKIAPPFVAFSKNGAITSVKSVKEMDAVLK